MEPRAEVEERGPLRVICDGGQLLALFTKPSHAREYKHTHAGNSRYTHIHAQAHCKENH